MNRPLLSTIGIFRFHDTLGGRVPSAWVALFVLFSLLLSEPARAEERVEVEIRGVRDELLENIRAHLSLQSPPSPLTEATVRRLYRQAPEEIERALQALGYYHPGIRSELTPIEAGWRARFEIDPGPPVRIGRIDIRLSGEGADDPPLREILEKLPIERGEILHHGEYEESKGMIQRLAAERGYFDARFTTHRIELDLLENRATVLLAFDTGPRYYLGEVRFRQDVLDPDFMERFVPFEPGEPFHTNRLLALNNALTSAGYFLRIDVRLLQEEAVDRVIPVEVVLVERMRYQFSAGAGYGTDTGPRLILGWENRRVNARGHRFESQLELSLLRQSITADYEIPLARPGTDKLRFQVGYQEEDTPTAESRIWTVGASRTALRGSSWLETIFLNYRAERFEVGEQVGHSRLVLPGISWTRAVSDHPIDPRSGSRLTFTFQGTDPALGSDVRLFQSQVRGKLIHPLGHRGRILLRGDLGATHIADFTELPASLRFFAGGDRSVRGYRYNALGPVDETGQVIGGRYLMVGSAEYDYRIGDQYGVALFYDIGNAINDLDDPLRESAGIGIRWISPVGPVRIDLAFALREPDISIRVHINMGPDL